MKHLNLMKRNSFFLLFSFLTIISLKSVFASSFDDKTESQTFDFTTSNDISSSNVIDSSSDASHSFSKIKKNTQTSNNIMTTRRKNRRIDEIAQSLSLEFPTVIHKIIKSYDYDSFHDLYERVILQLNSLSSKDSKEYSGNNTGIDIDIDFDSKDFIYKIYKILSKNEAFLSFGNNNSFRKDQRKLVFKWMLHLKKTFKKDFHEILNEMKPAYDWLRQRLDLPYISAFYNLNFGFDYDLDGRVRALLCSEILDRGDEIFTLYESVMKEFYYRTGNCQVIMKKYFNGHFDNDPILQYMIQNYDEKGEVAKCFDDPNYISSSFPKKTNNDNDNDNSDHDGNDNELIKFKVARDFGHGYDYIDICILDFYRRNNVHFMIVDHSRLYILLRSLKKMNSLTREILEKVVGLSSHWNPTIYKEYLLVGKKSFQFSLDYEEFSKLIDSND